MPLIHESYDCLPYVDAPPTEASLADATALIDADIKSAGIDTSQTHPALIPATTYTPQFSPAVEEEHARLFKDASSKLAAIDMKRYEDIEAPEKTDPTTDEKHPEILEQWNQALRKAYTSSEYVGARLTELGLLEKFGKNAWLVGNSQLEDILKRIETELADVRKQQDEVEGVRTSQQQAVAGELAALEDTWQKGVGRMLETEVAAEGLKQQILDMRRAGAV
ncbi:hypothetical protein EJ04DRAFT_301116 [Polyplosphaeria fusca]|uniref:Pre-mRNA-splicing factor SPF27 n=1 Tax=Polyplosphaeria fusca TaxID=682080 RepID=A0A9P4QSA6_9PLEO|nr:hypothetical protein EJ04DRAFT_301116 [Polyplosphaeria fusca]